VARRGEQHKQPNALVAAATAIQLAEPKVAARQAAKRQEWQTEAWGYFDEVPEIKESIRYRGNQLGKLRLYVAVQNPEDPEGAPIPVTDEASGVPPAVAEQAMAELRRLRSEVGGQAEILRELDMNLEVAGECYLVGWGGWSETITQRDGTTQELEHAETWEVRSVSEVDVKSGRYYVKDSPDQRQGKPLDPERDTIIRIWTRHPQWSALPDSAMRGLLGDCKLLQAMQQQLQAHTWRGVSAGFFTVPNELSFGPADPTQPDGDGDDDAGADPLDAVLHQVLVDPIADPSAPSTVQPGLLRGPAEYLKPDVLRRIPFFDKEHVEGLEAGIRARVDRIARGLNLPVEKVMGHQNTTYANAAQVDEDEFNDYLRPSADTGVEALSFAFLTPQLRENPLVPPEWSDGRLFVWYDPKGLIRQPDLAETATEGWTLGLLSDDAWRAAKGYGDDAAPEPVDLLIRAGLRRGIFTADITMALLDLLGVELEVPEADDGTPLGEPDQVGTGEPEDGDDGDDGEEGDEAITAAARAVLHQLATSDDPTHKQVLHQLLAHVVGHRPTPMPPRAGTLPAQPLALAAATTGPDAGRQLMELDRELRTRLSVAANDAMTRALEKAGNRLRSKTNGTEHRTLLRNVPVTHGFATLGQTLVAQVFGDDDPLDGAWDELEAQFLTWGERAQDEALDVAHRVSSGFSTSERRQLQLRQADDLAQAWAWMREALTALATARMFDPDPSAPEVGEFDPTLKVPTGLVRQALARAGGATGLVTEDGDGAWVALTDGGTRPAGGIGTGELVRGALRDNGAMVEGYRWVYGPAFRQRPFEPHRNLDGVTFQNFDDPVLANPNSFPPFGFYMPGDHTGCICDFEPTIIPADEVS